MNRQTDQKKEHQASHELRVHHFAGFDCFFDLDETVCSRTKSTMMINDAGAIEASKVTRNELVRRQRVVVKR